MAKQGTFKWALKAARAGHEVGRLPWPGQLKIVDDYLVWVDDPRHHSARLRVSDYEAKDWVIRK